MSGLSAIAVLQLTTMIETSPSSESYTKPSPLDEARGHTSERGITLPTGAYMLQQDSPLTPEASLRIQELVSGLAKALVDSPDAVSVEVIPETASTVLRLRVAPTDIGKVIGKQGRTARSIRTILSAASMKMQHRFSLDIVEEGIASVAPQDTNNAPQA
jgi:predicted RNA-binding protein YlqC (UPF0109 family)